jgi:hypothetical protein
MRLIIALLLVLVPASVFASPITFDFRAPGIEDIDEVNSFSLLQDGFTVTLTAFPTTFSGNDVVLNRTASAFGINVVGTTCGGLEDSALIDGGCTGEYVTMSFDQNVFLNSLTVSSFGSLDVGRITIGSTNLDVLSTGAYSLGNPFLAAGDTFSLAWMSGNGFSFDNLTVTAAPEPSSLVLLVFGTGLIGLAVFRGRLRA